MKRIDNNNNRQMDKTSASAAENLVSAENSADMMKKRGNGILCMVEWVSCIMQHPNAIIIFEM